MRNGKYPHPLSEMGSSAGEAVGGPQRLNRILSYAGLASRRQADGWIQKGRVTVNGRTVSEPGAKATWGIDLIEVDGKEIKGPSPRLYLMLNKPFGYVCSLREHEDRPLVTGLLKDVSERVYPVGRLDFDTMGLLLFTNDGEWAFRLTHPRYRIPRTYKVTVAGYVTLEAVTALKDGVFLEDGFSGRAKVKLISRDSRQSVLRLTIVQGRNRQVRRMLATIGYKVAHLIRIGFGNLFLGDLKVGEFRQLEKNEVFRMRKLIGMA